METLSPYLASIDNLLKESHGDKKDYIHPKLKNVGVISLVLIREAIAPVVFRNSEEEITDIEINKLDDVYIRAVSNKFKYPERGRGLQILRAFGVGGRLPQNKTVVTKGQKISDTTLTIHTNDTSKILKILAENNLPLWRLELLEKDIYEAISNE